MKRINCLILSVTSLLSVSAANAVETDLAKLRALASSTNYAEVATNFQPLVEGPDAENAEAHFYYGRALYRLGKFSLAKQALEKCIALESEGWFVPYAQQDLDVINSQDSIKGSSTTGGRKGYLGIYIERNVVKKVIPNSPAALGRITAGDIIVSINKAPISATSSDVLARLNGIVGTPVDLVISRAGKQYSCPRIRASGLIIDGSNEMLFEDKGERRSATSISSTTKSLTPKTSRQATLNVLPTAKSARSINESDAAFIKVQRQTTDTTTARQKILEALAYIPSNVKNEFQGYGLSILLTPTILEARPDLANQKPRGYDTGGGYDNCPGFFMTQDKTIYVAEKYGVYSQPFRVSNSVFQTTLHEGGHAYDSMRGNLSKTEAFLALYRQDCGKLTNESRRKVTYFLQADSAGPSELFAELFVYSVAPGSKDDWGVTTSFPLTYQFMKDQVKDRH